MSKTQFELGSLIVAGLMAIGMLAGGITWLTSVEAKASNALVQTTNLSAQFSEFKDDAIDRLARIEEDTKAIRHKH